MNPNSIRPEELDGWQPITKRPPLKPGSLGILECRDLIVWMDDPHARGFFKGGCCLFSGGKQLRFWADGHNGDWNITHWMLIGPPKSTLQQSAVVQGEPII